MATVSHWWMWAIFLGFIALMLFTDLFLLGGRKSHKISTKEALLWSLVWFGLAVIFNFLFWLYLNHHTTSAIADTKALEFFTGYLIEKSLSVDNLFVILLIFNYFLIPIEYQHRVLIYGVIGAIIMRLILILIGVWLVDEFHWVLYIFGALIVFLGIKMFMFADKEPDISQNPILIWLKKNLRLTESLQGTRFFIRQNGLLYFTPLFLALVLVEITDVIFAVDSIPAIFAITHDPFIVFTSNIFAILGLRALYFLLAHMQQKFGLLKYGLAFILVFIGCKMLLAPWVKIPIFIALGVVILTLFICILLSLYKDQKKTEHRP